MALNTARAPWFAGLALCALLNGTPAGAAQTGVAAVPKASAPPATATFIEAPSSETPAARKKRLRKECKGRPNAGACLGHTR
jgi:hypothetical protein